jgi:thiamine transporter
MKERRTRLLLEISLTIALSAVLSMITIWRMPQGGSVSLGMLPLFVLAFRRGLAPGLVAGGLYGLVDLMVDPFPPVHWVQPILDYPVAYLMVGLAGVVSVALRPELQTRSTRRVALLLAAGITLGSAGRYLAHFVSGMVFFGEFAPPGQPVWLYSALYNLYVPISALACFAAAVVVVPALAGILPVSEERTPR